MCNRADGLRPASCCNAVKALRVVCAGIGRYVTANVFPDLPA